MTHPVKHGQPGAPAARWFDIANLRAQIRMAQDGLSRLDDFERRWDALVAELRRNLSKAYSRPNFDEVLPPEVMLPAETLRLDLQSRQDTAMPTYRDPLAMFLRTSLLVFSEELWGLIGVCHRGPGGTLLLPMGDVGDALYEVDLGKFERNIGEARSEIARYRLVLEAQRGTHNTLLEEAERAEAESRRAMSLWRLAGERIKEGPVGKAVWWFAADKTRNLIWFVLGAAIVAAVPSLRGCVSRLVSPVNPPADSTAHVKR